MPPKKQCYFDFVADTHVTFMPAHTDALLAVHFVFRVAVHMLSTQLRIFICNDKTESAVSCSTDTADNLPVYSNVTVKDAVKILMTELKFPAVPKVQEYGAGF